MEPGYSQTKLTFADYLRFPDESDIVVPDLIYLSNERAHLLTAKNLPGPPDLIVEILSPSTSSRDRELKRALRTGWNLGVLDD